MLCPNCETENSPDARFCDECGFPLSGSIARAGAGSSPSPRRPSPPSQAETAFAPARKENPEPDRPDPIFSPAPFSDRDDYPSGNLFRQEEVPSRAQAGPYSGSADGAVYGEEGYDAFEEGKTVVLEPSEPSPSPAEEEGFGTFRSFDSFRSFDRPYTSIDPIGVPDGAEGVFEDDPPRKAATVAFDDPATHGRSRRPKDTVAPTIEFDRDEGEGEDALFSAPAPQERRPPRQQRSFKAAPQRQPLNGKQRALIVGGVAVVLASLVLVIGFALGLWGGVAVPNVVGMDQGEAEATLQQKGFVPKAAPMPSDEIEGRVLAMEPGGGSFAEEGAEVTIRVATARTIPAVVGESRDQAQQMLEQAGYTNVTYATEFTDGEENVVVAVSPAPDTRAKSSMAVTVTVSQNYRVPDISSMNLEEAQAAIEEAGLDSTVSYVDTDQYPDGTVLGTDPGAGTKVSSGDSIAINVARARGVELMALAKDLLAEGETVEIGGVNYQVQSVDEISYEGDDTVAYTITAKPFVTFFGETLYSSSTQNLSGQIVFSSDNEVLGIY